MPQRHNFRRNRFMLTAVVILAIVLQPSILFATTLTAAPLQSFPLPASGKKRPMTSANSERIAPAIQQDARVATDWFDLYLHLVKTTNGFSPPVAARAFGYAGVTLYETVAPGFSNYRSLAGQLNGLSGLPQPTGTEEFDWVTAANAALAHITRNLFATTLQGNLTAIQALERYWNQERSSKIDASTYVRSARYGQQMADAIFAWSKTDGGHEGYLRNFPKGYKSQYDTHHWLPTPPRFQLTPLQPNWGENRPFVLTSGNVCPPTPPLAYSEAQTSAFYREAIEVYNTAQQITTEQEAIARFWSDDPGETATPPGHSVSIATQVLKQGNASLILAAETYAKVGIAVTDAFIGCWNAKYKYNLVRPVTYIRRLLEPKWNSLLTTPPFPEYPSGHSVQSAAVAVVLTDLFGEHYAFVDRTHDGRGLPPRAFTSFAAFAEEAGLSRLYGGIHYRRAIELGSVQGECIGETVNALHFRR